VDQGFEMWLIPTLALPGTGETMLNSRDENDPKDDQVILYLWKTPLAQT
jgi:hypothetical protein